MGMYLVVATADGQADMCMIAFGVVEAVDGVTEAALKGWSAAAADMATGEIVAMAFPA